LVIHQLLQRTAVKSREIVKFKNKSLQTPEKEKNMVRIVNEHIDIITLQQP